MDDVARWGAPQAAAEILSTIPTESPLSDTRAAGIRAHTSRHPDHLLAAAEQHLTLQLWGHAAELADLTVMRTATHGGVRAHPRITRAKQNARQARHNLKHPTTDQPATVLTDREFQVATMAARTMSDRDIADNLGLSIRTVQTHLRSTYTKLASRRAVHFNGLEGRY